MIHVLTFDNEGYVTGGYVVESDGTNGVESSNAVKVPENLYRRVMDALDSKSDFQYIGGDIVEIESPEKCCRNARSEIREYVSEVIKTYPIRDEYKGNTYEVPITGDFLSLLSSCSTLEKNLRWYFGDTWISLSDRDVNRVLTDYIEFRDKAIWIAYAMCERINWVEEKQQLPVSEKVDSIKYEAIKSLGVLNDKRY